FIFTLQSTSFANINLSNVSTVWRGDYCANAGDQMWISELATPRSAIPMDEGTFKFDRTDDPTLRGYSTGVSYYQSSVAIREITGGTSHKYMVGEKFLYSDKYFTGDDQGDNHWLWTGWDNDLYRTAGVDYLATPTPNASTPSSIPP